MPGRSASWVRPAIVRVGVRQAARLAVTGLATCLAVVAFAGYSSSRDTLHTIAQAELEARLSNSYSHVMGAFLAVDRARRDQLPDSTPSSGRSPAIRTDRYQQARAELDRAVEQVRANGRHQDRALASYLAVEARRFDQHGRTVDWDTLEVLVTTAADVHRSRADDALHRLKQRRQQQAALTPWLIGVTGAFLATCAVLLLLLQREVQQQADEHRYRAEHDELTGLANRAGFLHQLREAVTDADRSESTVTVLLLDLDDFKPVNDRWGHQAGDVLLRSTAARLRAALRPGDVAARLGGDEFGALLTGLPARDVAALVTRLRALLAEPYDVEGLDVVAPASIGTATASGGDLSSDGLLRAADLAMYREKHARKADVTDRPPTPPTQPRPRGEVSQAYS